MGVDSGEQGGRGPPPNFQTWYKWLKSAIFWPFLLFFGLFSIGPRLEEANSAIFRYFLLIFELFFR